MLRFEMDVLAADLMARTIEGVIVPCAGVTRVAAEDPDPDDDPDDPDDPDDDPDDPPAAADYAIALFAAGLISLQEARGYLGIPSSIASPDLSPGKV